MRSVLSADQTVAGLKLHPFAPSDARERQNAEHESQRGGDRRQSPPEAAIPRTRVRHLELFDGAANDARGDLVLFENETREKRAVAHEVDESWNAFRVTVYRSKSAGGEVDFGDPTGHREPVPDVLREVLTR